MQIPNDVIDFENSIFCPPTDTSKSPACLFVLNRIPWNLLGFASMALLQNQQTNLGFRLQQPAYNIQLFIIYWHRIIIWAAE